MSLLADHKTVPASPAEDIPVGSIDILPRLAARRWPGRVAVHCGERTLTFAKLDQRVSKLAAGLRSVLGGEGSVVAVSSVAGADFPIAYYAVPRSGNIVAPLNPLLPPETTVRLLKLSGARAALLSKAVYEKVQPELHRLPRLELILLLDTSLGKAGPATCAELADRGDLDVAPQDRTEETAAAIMFTSGSTGPSKAAVLSQRNLKSNAWQIGVAHDLTEDSIVVNALPLYHPMHLNAGLLAGATQVIASGPDLAVAVREAQHDRATHFYALPFQLAKLAHHPELDSLRMPWVRVAATGGVALPPSTVDKLTKHFGFTLLQGYGMTETAGLAHSDSLVRPKSGSVGPALPGAQTRIVGLDGDAPLPSGSVGRIQVRGPHVLSGYLGGGPVTDADGWFDTGDAGYLDADGYLFVLDRVRDLFASHGELVSPTSLERKLHAHPAIRECVVVSLPDPAAESVAGALIALHSNESLADILTAVNAGVPQAQRIVHAEVIDAIPRLPNGKVSRVAMRDELLARITVPS